MGCLRFFHIGLGRFNLLFGVHDPFIEIGLLELHEQVADFDDFTFGKKLDDLELAPHPGGDDIFGLYRFQLTAFELE